MRRCLSMQNLSANVEVCALLTIADIGMKVVWAGFSQSDEHPWARGVELEVSQSVSEKALND